MKRTLIIAAVVLIVAGGIWAQEPQAPSPQDMKPAPQNAKDLENAKYTNESIARLSFIEGKTFVQRASDLGYEEGALNMPISEGDRIGTSDGRAEIHFGKGNFIRLDAETKLDVLNLPKKDDDVARLRVWSGSVYLVVGTLKKEKGIELHTADSSFYVLDRGVYRVDVRENRDTEIEVFEGLIEVAGEDGSSLLKAGQRLEVSEGRFASKPSSFIAVANDSFDKFNESRNSATRRQFAKAYLPEELSDFEAELDEYGEWKYLPPYGNVWVPGGVEDDWRPYYNGRWTWLPLSGWTWWPYEPWGWSTFHYGRWHWGFDIGWYWIPMNMWGPAWVNWWWDDFYFGWAPLSYWGYPGVLMGGHYYGHYYGPYYPNGSAALTVIRKDHLKAPGIAANALRGDSLKSLNKMSLTSRNLSLRPAGTKISVQPLEGGRVMLRKDDSRTGLTQDKRGLSGAASASSPRAIRRPSETGASKGATSGTAAKPQSVKSPDKGSAKAAPAKGSSPSKGSGTSDRKIRKKDGGAMTSAGASSGYAGSSSIGRNVNGYPSSPRITRPANYGDRGASRARTFSGPGRSSYSPRSGAVRSGGSTSSSGRSSARVGSSSGSRSSGASRSSGSRGSSPSRGSSSGSRGSSGGSVRKK